MIQQRVLTFYTGNEYYPGKYGQHYGGDEHKYRSLNQTINSLIERNDVTAHSVSYSSSSNETHDTKDIGIMVQVYATVLYTGPSALEIYGTNNEYFNGTIEHDTTVLSIA
jgi:hypothetical protein